MVIHFFMKLTALFGIMIASHTAIAQTNQNMALPWKQKAPPVPELAIPATAREWEKQRAEIRAEIWKLFGQLPPRPTVPEVKILSREDKGDYILEKFQFDNGSGAIVPGYLLLPKNGGKKSPAILYHHWHGGEYGVGKEELFHARHTPFAPGPVLAQRGYVVLAIDCYCFGERNGQGPAGAPQDKAGGEMSAAKFQLWYGRCLWGMIVRDDLMALDYLCSRPEVDTNNIGVTGMSLGSTRSWWLMALDDRIKTGVNVACFTRYQNLLEHDALGAHGIYYFVPGMLNHFDTEAVIASIAPRPVLFMTGDADPGSPIDGIRVIESKTKSVYDLYGKTNEFQSVIYPGLGHVYLPEMWEKALNWLDQHLKPGR